MRPHRRHTRHPRVLKRRRRLAEVRPVVRHAHRHPPRRQVRALAPHLTPAHPHRRSRHVPEAAGQTAAEDKAAPRHGHRRPTPGRTAGRRQPRHRLVSKHAKLGRCPARVHAAVRAHPDSPARPSTRMRRVHGPRQRRLARHPRRRQPHRRRRAPSRAGLKHTRQARHVRQARSVHSHKRAPPSRTRPRCHVRYGHQCRRRSLDKRPRCCRTSHRFER